MKVAIIGGAGFIGTNAAEFYLQRGDNVSIIDSLARRGSTRNLEYLQKFSKVKFVQADIRNQNDAEMRIRPEMANSDLVLHLAAQVAVTTSVANPREDFETNVLGTFNVLEALRGIQSQFGKAPPLIFASTNKVYGKMDYLPVVDLGDAYAYEGDISGINEQVPLDFFSPYGCSKGAGDQYVRDYSRMFDLRTVVMRQSCIYGKHQFGMEDQGWVAWFTIAHELGKPITVFGDGKQVRDVLFADDLIRAYDAAYHNIERTAGKVYNIGGGPANTLSLLQLMKEVGHLSGREFRYKQGDWRPGDQKVCIMDISKSNEDFGWKPSTPASVGVRQLYSWVKDNREAISKFL